MDYTHLSADQQKQIREQTIASIEAEHYSVSLALARATASEENTEQLEERLGALEKQHAALVD